MGKKSSQPDEEQKKPRDKVANYLCEGLEGIRRTECMNFYERWIKDEQRKFEKGGEKGI